MAEETNPRAAAAVARLKKWAITEGAPIFRWGTPGDHQRCRDFYKDKLPARMIDGWCANLHRLATGARPGQAPGERKG
jgi:hypothetical protein